MLKPNLDPAELTSRLGREFPDLPAAGIAPFIQYLELLRGESAVQNLTKLLSDDDFIDGHLRDVIELERSGQLGLKALDLGSGAGIPGLVSALFWPERQWVLVDSERRKAEFLSKVVMELGLSSRVLVVHDRIEKILPAVEVDSITAKAVGKLGEVYGWIRKRSTWNNLILLKGPAWEMEWWQFQQSPLSGELQIAGEHRYTSGPEAKKRLIVRLNRTNVPRRTS